VDPDSRPLLEEEAVLVRRAEFKCKPRAAPSSLWDVADEAFLELVRCRAFMRVTKVDPKEGVFEVRMKCLWSFRTKNSGEQAEITMRGVPGIRMPGLRVTVEESRIWKDLNFDANHGRSQSCGGPSKDTLLWRGTSIFTMDGWKAFDLRTFPFDRHVLNLERLEFVWRSDKDSADYHKSLKVVEFTTETSSMLPEWKTYPALLTVMNELESDVERPLHLLEDKVGAGKTLKAPSYATKFSVCLRIERKCTFYSWQVFLVTYLITMLSCFPLGMPPKLDFLGDRLNMYAAGVLTLVAYKTGINDHLPNVPYQTFTDWYLLAAIMTLFFAAVGTLYPYRLTEIRDQDDDETDEEMKAIYEAKYRLLDSSENVILGILFAAWTFTVLLVFFVKPNRRTSWDEIIESSTTDAFGADDFTPPDHAEEESERRTEVSPTVNFENILRTQNARRPEFKRPVLEWDKDDVARFLKTLQLGHCAEKLMAMADGPEAGRKLAALSEGQLRSCGLTQLQAKKVASRLRARQDEEEEGD
jgi:hypothetical protein